MSKATRAKSHTKSLNRPVGPATEAWRIFCAVEIPQHVSKLLIEHIEKLRARFPAVSASWSREGKFHLTLKFLGDVPQQRIEALSLAAAQAVENSGAIPIKVGGTGSFPKHGSPRVLWIGIDDSVGRLTQLQDRLENACDPLGFPREERPFHPHLTIARVRRPHGAKELAEAHRNLEFAPIDVTVEELIVFRSELGRDGSKYTPLSRHPLK